MGSVSEETEIGRVDPKRREQHLVSAGYQRNFADGRRVAVLDAQTGVVVDQSRLTRENWKLTDFISVISPEGDVDDSLEREFAKDEQKILNIVREVSLDTPVTDRQKRALDKLAAIHLVRSVSFATAHEAVVGGWLRSGALDLAADPRLPVLFEREKGRKPVPGELERLVASLAGKFAAQADLLAQGIRRGAGSIPEILGKSSIQLIGSLESLPGFLLPDNPVIHGRRLQGLFGFANAGALGDADLVAIPINRHLVGFYSRRRLNKVQIRTKNGVLAVNALLIRSATSEVLCHPDDALHTSRLIRNIDRYPAEMFDERRIR